MIRYYIIDIGESIIRKEIMYLKGDEETLTNNTNMAYEFVPNRAEKICILGKNLVMKPIKKY